MPKISNLWFNITQLILIDKATHDNIEIIGGEQYYNNIAEFINNAIPKKPVKVRNKKMA